MSWRRIWFLLAVCWLSAALSGCMPGEDRLDEEKDPHFQRGRSLVNGEDFQGAAQEFEKALDTNPHSAAAHFELGWLYDTKLNDYAAAIYHYQRHMQLNPASPHAAQVLERIRSCKLELANSDFTLPNGGNMLKEVDRLNAENLLLRQQLAAMQAQLGAARGQQPAPIPIPVPAAPQPLAQMQPYAPPRAPAPAAPPASVAPVASAPRSYVVKQHDTMAAIASRYGVRISAMLAANPGVDPRRLQIGQSLQVPTREN